MPKRIAIEPFIAPDDGNALLSRFRKMLAGRLIPPFHMGIFKLYAERDGNANRWLVLKFQMKDSRVSIEGE